MNDFSPSQIARFWSYVDKSGSCWVWTAARVPGGYGRFRVGRGGDFGAHRVAYELVVGPIPEGLEIDHLCHSRSTTCAGGRSCPHRACVNPDHLEPVTRQVNISRGLTGRHLRAHLRSGFSNTICRVDGCLKPTLSRGWCITHYNRWYQRERKNRSRLDLT